VTVVNHGPQIAARADAQAAAELQAALEDEGIDIILNAGVDSFARNGRLVDAIVHGRTLSVSHVLLASGRTPNVEQRGLERIGVEVGRGGIVVDERQRTSVDGIWAAGDVAAGPMFTPTAQYQSRGCPSARRDGRRARKSPPRLSELRRGREGRGREAV
jgi:pyruvate/2-oxoglutarate dehydrogenase complex dihydrolipoamide dehydrogenase (E3) component